MRNMLLIIFAAFALALAGCRTQPRAESTPAPHSELRTPHSYTRIANPDTNTVQLQIALRKFVPLHHRGPAIWLAGTMHVGEPDYYRALQKYLDTQTIVLYEGINTETHERHVQSDKQNKTQAHSSPSPLSAGARAGVRGNDLTDDGTQTGTNAGFSMQAALADSLGLVFQLNAIDYERTNFLNSDLSVLQIQRLMAGETNAISALPGKQTKSNSSFDTLLQVMDGTSLLGSLVKVGMQFIGANPKLQALAKLTLIEAVGRLKGDFSDLRGLPPDLKQMVKVLIEARNQNVLADLKTELKVIPHTGSIAVFYGTGHMEDLERRVTRELHYQPADEIWLTAFSVDLRKSGLSPAEVQVMRNLVKWQLDQMQQF